MFNVFQYNVVICPWVKQSPLGGCSIPGTDNPGADNNIGYAGIWSVSQSNYVIGNRVTNTYNAILFEVGFDQGQGQAKGRVCPQKGPLVGLIGNTCHGVARFGAYIQNNASPKHISQQLANDGYPDMDSCDVVWLDDGTDNGFPMRLSDNVDYDSVFVGGYNMADIQWHAHSSLYCLSGMYWKNTKNFADGCSSHIKVFLGVNTREGFFITRMF
jgi:hypothetical protein